MSQWFIFQSQANTDIRNYVVTSRTTAKINYGHSSFVAARGFLEQLTFRHTIIKTSHHFSKKIKTYLIVWASTDRDMINCHRTPILGESDIEYQYYWEMLAILKSLTNITIIKDPVQWDSQLSTKHEIALSAVPRYWGLELMLLPSIKYDFTILRRVIMTLILLKTNTYFTS